MTNHLKRAVKGVSFVLITTASAALISYFTRIYLARNLSVSDFGLFWSVFTLLMFLLIFRDIGLNPAQTKYVAEAYAQQNYSKIKTIFVSSFIFKLISSSLLMAAFIFGARYLSEHYFESPLAYFVMVNLSMYIFFSFLLGHVQSLLQGFQEVRWFPLTEPFRLGLALFFSILFFRWDLGVMAPVFGFVAGALLTFLIIIWGLRKYRFIWKYPLTDFWGTTKQLFKFGLPVIFTGAGEKVVSHFDILMLTAMVSLAEVGVYSAALSTALLFLFFSRAITPILFPMIAEFIGKKDYSKISAGMNLIYTYTFILMIPLLITVLVFADYFITTFFGQEFAPGVMAFRILLLGVLFYVVANINDSAISSLGKPLVVTKIILLSSLANVLLNLWLIPRLGIEGAAIATAFSYLLTLVLSTVWLVRRAQLHPPWWPWLKLSVVGLIFGITLYYVKSLWAVSELWSLILSFSCAVIIYLPLLFLLKIVTLKNLQQLWGRIKQS